MNNGRQVTRRRFLQSAGMAAVSAAVFPQIVRPETLGLNGTTAPNGRIRVAVIGCGNRAAPSGSGYYLRSGQTELAALCDPYRLRMRSLKEKFAGIPDAAPERIDEYTDFREVLDRVDIDAVHIVTGDYWHVPIALAAARSGCDVFCEKPLAVSIGQCLAAREIVRKHNRVFQYGTINRGNDQVRLGIQLALNGAIGEIKEAIVWANGGQSGGSATPVLPVPEGFDYEIWLGPAPYAPFCEDRCLVQGNRNGIFHIYDYSLGFIAGWGAHAMDSFQWYADHAGLDVPVRYEGTGTLPTEGLFDTTLTWDIHCTYANGFKMRFMDNKSYKALGDPKLPQFDLNHGTLFLGDKGWIAVSRGTWAFSDDAIRRKAAEPMKIELKDRGFLPSDFIDCMIDRSKPLCDLESAVKSDLICHCSDLVVRTGLGLTWDPVKESILDNDEARKRMRRPMRPPWNEIVEKQDTTHSGKQI